MDAKSTFIAGLIAGALGGAAAALLLSPKEGRETREIILDRANQVRGRAAEQISSLRERVRRDTGGEVIDAAADDDL